MAAMAVGVIFSIILAAYYRALSIDLLKTAFASAEQNGVLLYDIMTERYEITTIMQKELSQIPGVFGKQEKGTPEEPAITKESVHHFFKYVSLYYIKP